MKKFFLILSFVFILLLVTNATSAETRQYSKVYQGSKVYVIESSYKNLSLDHSITNKTLLHRIKDNNALGGINLSYYDMNTKRVCGLLIINNVLITKNIYNRPFLAWNDNKVFISDGNKPPINVTNAVAGGSWLVKNNKPYSTYDHFTSSFKNSIVRRTCIGITKDNKVLIVVMNAASLKKASKIMIMLGACEAFNCDGGTSSQMAFKSRTIMYSKRTVPVVLLVK